MEKVVDVVLKYKLDKIKTEFDYNSFVFNKEYGIFSRIDSTIYGTIIDKKYNADNHMVTYNIQGKHNQITVNIFIDISEEHKHDYTIFKYDDDTHENYILFCEGIINGEIYTKSHLGTVNAISKLTEKLN